MGFKAILGLGVKGEDVVLSTFKKLEKEKEKFEKPANAQLGITPPSMQPPRAGFGKGDDRGKGDDSNESDSQRRGRQKQERASEKTSLAASALEKAAQGFASLDPTQFIRAAASSSTQLMSGLAGGAANSLWTGSGEIVRAIIDHAGRLVDMGIQAASGALQAYKTALPQVTEYKAQASITDFAGVSRGYQSTTRAEMAQLTAALLPTVGKIGDRFEKQLDRLFQRQSGGEIVNRRQASALAQGDFSVLGTNKGWVMNQIMQSVSGAMPGVQQQFRAALLEQVNLEGGEVAKEGYGVRAQAQAIETSDLQTLEKIVAAGGKNWDALSKANSSLNSLQVKMIESVNSLNMVLGEAANTLSKTLGNLHKEISEARREAQAKMNTSGRRGRHR